MEKFLRGLNVSYEVLFRFHDLLADALIRFGKEIRWSMLIGAHASLIVGLLHPEFRRSFGSAAGTLLIVLLFVSPLSKIFRMKLLLLLMGFRREMGILMGYLALVHGISYMISGYDVRNIFSFSRLDFVALAPFFGFVAMWLLIPLLLTSNRIATRMLGIWWKRLHFLVYPAFVLVVLHRLFITSGREESSFMLRGLEALLLIGSYGILKLLAWKDCSPTLRKVSHAVAMAYHNYEKDEIIQRV